MFANGNLRFLLVSCALACGCSVLFAPADEDCYKLEQGCPSSDWTTIQGSCSCYLAGDTVTAAEGFVACKERGAHLLAIETEQEQEAVLAMLDGNANDFRLGLFYNGEDWQWDTGDRLEDTFSMLESVDDPPAEPCSQFNKDQLGIWTVKSCDVEDIVCELDGLLAVDSPPALASPRSLTD